MKGIHCKKVSTELVRCLTSMRNVLHHFSDVNDPTLKAHIHVGQLCGNERSFGFTSMLIVALLMCKVVLHNEYHLEMCAVTPI